TLAKFSTGERSALLRWVHTGGTLIVYEVRDNAAASAPLRELLVLDEHAAVSEEWQKAELSRRQRLTLPAPERLAAAGYGAMQSTSVDEAEDESPPALDFVWPESAETFLVRELMLGRV